MAPSPLDFELEKHEGPEPRVLTADVQAILQQVIRPGDEDNGESVALIAEKASISTRTVYRVLQRSTETISLDLADRLCLAADSHVAACQLVYPDGRVESYF
jgi:DNA invertase Pin-like site-specific DNA recombinase